MRIMNTNVTIAPGTSVVTAGAAVQISDMAGAVDLGALPSKFLRHAAAEGLADTPVPGVKMFRVNSQTPRAPCVYEPCVIVILQGEKRGYFGTHAFEYGAATYTVFSVPIPMEAEIVSASPDKPFLGLALSIDPAAIADLQMRIEDAPMPAPKTAGSIAVSPVDATMSDALHRLVATFGDQSDARVLGPMIVREIFYRVLSEHKGIVLSAAVSRHSHYHRITQLLRQIQDDCSVSYSTAEMASIANMSKTSLHESFKSITAMTPLQYVKSIRLHQARLLMMGEGLSASAAAYRVGYASASQFSREFKRLFGLSPRLDMQRESNEPRA